MRKNIKIGLIYGSDTGCTEDIAKEIKNNWTLTPLEVIEGSEMTIDDFQKHQFIILGCPTWYDGDLQSDFEDFFEDFKTINFTGKTVAMFGLGDQYGYPEYFVDALGILGEVIIKNGGSIIGMWPDKGYTYDESKGIFKEGLFYGLAIDEDNQMELTKERLELWMSQIEKEFIQAFNNYEIQQIA